MKLQQKPSKMKTTSMITRTGTECLMTTEIFLGKEYNRFYLLNNSRQVIAIFKNYEGLTPAPAPFNIHGTEVAVAIDTNSYGWNNSDLKTRLYLAKEIQENVGVFHYENPIHKIAEKLKNSDYFYAAKENIELKKNKFALEKRISNLKIFGTENEKQIEKIKLQRKKEADKAAKTAEKNYKIKVSETKKMLKDKLKEGFNYVAILRVWTGSRKHLKFQGETKEFRKEKPTTKNYISFDKTNLESAAKEFLKY